MAQFRGTIKGNRGGTSRLGSKSSGLQVRADGWQSGVKVEAHHNGTRDIFRVFSTGGSFSDFGYLVCEIYKDDEGKIKVKQIEEKTKRM